MTFDLLHDPWIPVRHLTGRAPSDEFSLLDVYRRGADVDLGEYGLLLPALARQVFVPIVMRALGTPTSVDEWLDLWEFRADCADCAAAVEEYLQPFEQWFRVGTGLPYGAWMVQDVGRTSAAFGIEKILPGAPSGNNVPITTWAISGDYAVPVPKAVRAVLVEHCWGTSGRKSSVAGARSTHPGSVGVCGRAQNVMPVGANLLDTIFLNVPLIPDGVADDDLPPWERDLGVAGEVREPRGIMELLTWQSRRIMVYPDDAGLVTHCVVTAGDGSTGASAIDPHVSWTTNAKGEPTSRKASRTQPTWHGLPALLTPGGSSETGGAPPQLETLAEGLAVEEPDYPLRLHVSGAIYGDMRATIAHLTSDIIPTQISLLRANSTTRITLDHAVNTVKEARGIVGKLAYKVGEIRGADDVGAFANEWRGNLDAALAPRLHGLLLNLEDAGAVSTWVADAVAVSEGLVGELGTSVPIQIGLARQLPQAESVARRQLRDLLP